MFSSENWKLIRSTLLYMVLWFFMMFGIFWFLGSGIVNNPAIEGLKVQKEAVIELRGIRKALEAGKLER